ncbi:Sortase A, LPXTG specific [Alkalibacterium sp. AK22]|uniref:class A sortase n=1 Tax=Alkalibacterium sp. AK22 TaxID=1229520 RepID=UPI000447F1AB|nr:class A sortase [Alkalibacterium sp. AK22]EXJ23771.1 Sortase A, LPXTG specific [Alkalibacterium sp. AK22]
MKRFKVLVSGLTILLGITLFFHESVIDWRLHRFSESVIQNAVDEGQGIAEQREPNEETLFDFEQVEELSLTSLLTLPDIKGIHTLGAIYIPEVDLSLPILEGLSSDNLMVGAGTMKPNQEPGEGNYALAGHNWRDRKTLFSPLHRAEKGMLIIVEIKGQLYEYIITELFTVDPSRIDVIEDTEKSMITLVTCNHDGSERLIIQGTLV